MKTIAMVCILVLFPVFSVAELTERMDISTSVSMWFIDEYGPIFIDYFTNDRFTPEEFAATGFGEPVFTEYITHDQRTDVFSYRGFIIIVYYRYGYSLTVLGIHSTLLIVEDKWTLRPR